MKKYKTVPEFLADLDEAKRQQVEALRAIIFAVQPNLEEHIKWNAPSYVLDGEDRITFNLLNKEQIVKLVLHMGATRPENKKAAPVMPDPSGLVSWQSDIRGALSFADMAAITVNREAVHDLIARWLAIEV